jgi:hypothetical protein
LNSIYDYRNKSYDFLDSLVTSMLACVFYCRMILCPFSNELILVLRPSGWLMMV